MMRSCFEAFVRDEIWALEVLVGLNEGDLRDADGILGVCAINDKTFFSLLLTYPSYYFYITILPLCYFMGVFGFILNYKFI